VQTYNVRLESAVSTSFRCQRAADSLDIDSKKKSVHELSVTADIETAFSVGLIVGSSGSGKTSLARKIFGDNCFAERGFNHYEPIIDQFPSEMSYDECAEVLSGIGLTSVPCWIRPFSTLSNGQAARAMAALSVTKSDGLTVLDEWTSVVDRTVAKVMSHCVQKFVRRSQKSIVLLSCHRDVAEWLQPDWVIDCNDASFHRRLLQPRTEQLEFTVREIHKNTWPNFSKYHYLSERLPGGKLYLFGLFHGVDQVGFICYASYMPRRRGQPDTYHFNRVVIHPDFAGMGLGIRLVNETARLMRQHRVKIMGKFSSVPMFRSMVKDLHWRLRGIDRVIGKMPGGKCDRTTAPGGGGFRTNVKTYSFEYVGS
jgi:hypothetical protein